MATISVSLPSDGSTADVADYNTPITTIVNAINGGLDNTNLASGAAISGSKIADNSIDLEAKASADTGWREVTDSWSYASATTITVPTDATTKYSVGDKIRLTQSTVKYFYITGVTTTILTINGGTDYTLTNAAITDISYSKAATPVGFPQWFAYTPTFANTTLGSATVAGRFSMSGKTVSFMASFVLGAGSAIGTTPTATFPVTASSTSMVAGVSPIGHTNSNDTGTNSYVGPLMWNSTTTALPTVIVASGTYATIGTLSATGPFTFASGDGVYVEGSYEAA